MSSNSNERDVARGFGFGKPRARIPGLGTGGPLPSLAEALGVRPGTSVFLTGAGSAQLKKGLACTGARVMSITPSGGADCVVLRADTTYALRRIGELSALLGRGGVLWVLWPRNADHIGEQHVKRAGVSAGLTGAGTAHVSAQLAGAKFTSAQGRR